MVVDSVPFVPERETWSVWVKCSGPLGLLVGVARLLSARNIEGELIGIADLEAGEHLGEVNPNRNRYRGRRSFRRPDRWWEHPSG